MTTQSMANAKTEDFRNAHAALIRAGQAALSLAKIFNASSIAQKNMQTKEISLIEQNKL